MDLWPISHVALWILQLVTLLAVVALARQVGLLHLRLPPRGPGAKEEGPPIGQRLDLVGRHATTLRSVPMPIVDERMTIYVVVNATCSICEPVLKGLAPLSSVETDVRYLVAIDAEDGNPLDYLRGYGFDDGVPTHELPFIQLRSRPFATALAPDGTVLAAGVVNSLEQLEELQALAYRVAADLGMSGEAPPAEMEYGGIQSDGRHGLGPVASEEEADARSFG